jgi:uncharacterized protein YraI/uncharacterized protein YutE (UPF0331/DUF86 family)
VALVASCLKKAAKVACFNLSDYKNKFPTSAMSLLEQAITYSKTLESILEQKYGASGRGLHEKLTSIEERVPPELAKKLRFIASVRNKLVHEANYVPDDPEGFLRACREAIEQLKTAPRIDNRPAKPVFAPEAPKAPERPISPPPPTQRPPESPTLDPTTWPKPSPISVAIVLWLVAGFYYLTSSSSPWSSVPASSGSSSEPSNVQQYQSQTQLYVNTRQVNLRSGPGKEYGEMDKLPYGHPVTVIESAQSNNGKIWVRVNTGNKIGWINRSLLIDSQPSAIQEAPGTLYVNTKQLNIRSGPGAKYKEIGRLNYGQSVMVVDTAASVNGKPWSKISVDSMVGWVNNTLLSATQPPPIASEDAGTMGGQAPKCSDCQIPKEFFGLWLTPDDCSQSKKNPEYALESRLSIEAQEAGGYEHGCNLVKVNHSSTTVFSGDFSCAGEGEVWDSTKTFKLKGGMLFAGEDATGLVRCD